MTSESDGRKDERIPGGETPATRPPKLPPAVATTRPVAAESRKPEEVYRQRRSWLAAVIVIAATASVCALTWLPSRGEETPKPKRAVTNVKVQTVVARDVPDTLDLPGVVEPNRMVTVSARVGGQVTNVTRVDGRDDGRPCTRGETMVVLDTELLQVRVEQANALIAQFTAEIAQARAQRSQAMTERDSVKRLRERGASTDFTLRQAEDALVAAEAGIKRAEAGLAGAKAALKATTVDIGYATITAPIGGVLNEMIVEEGELVSPGDPVARIVDVATVRIALDVPQGDIHWVKLGKENNATVQMGLDAGAPTRTASGTVDYISELADPDAKTTRVEVLVDNALHHLRSGQIVRVRLRRCVLPRAIMVPLAAVITTEGDRVVYVVDAESKAEQRTVTLGRWRGRQVQILSGLSPGDTLIVEGHRYVAQGQEVKIKPDESVESKPAAPASRPASSVVASDRASGGRS